MLFRSYLKNIAHREAVNTVRKEYFGASRPASTLIEISQFVRPDLLIEIESVAVLPEKKGGAPRGKARASAPARKVRRRRRGVRPARLSRCHRGPARAARA